jgi:hypothetical protein
VELRETNTTVPNKFNNARNPSEMHKARSANEASIKEEVSKYHTFDRLAGNPYFS